MITVNRKPEAKKLSASGPRFGRVIKVVVKYREVWPSLVYIIDYDIGHETIKSCRYWLAKYIIYAGLYKVGEHYCRVVKYEKNNGKISVHIKIIYVNYRGNHLVNFPYYRSRHKTDILACKKEKLKQIRGREKEKARSKAKRKVGEKKDNLKPNINIDLES